MLALARLKKFMSGTQKSTEKKIRRLTLSQIHYDSIYAYTYSTIYIYDVLLIKMDMHNNTNDHIVSSFTALIKVTFYPFINILPNGLEALVLVLIS